MNKATKLVGLAAAGAIASAISMGVTSTAANAGDNEKCYGVAKAGKNDCQTANSSCAGTSKTDNQGDAWILVPKGTCDKLVGGSLEPKA